jgi:hypothetical protein
MHAQQFGAVGAILYNDPADYAPFGITPNQTFDQKWYMPPTGAQRGSAYTSNGDPLTPVYPSTGERWQCARRHRSCDATLVRCRLHVSY